MNHNITLSWRGSEDVLKGVATFKSVGMPDIVIEMPGFTDANELYKRIWQLTEDARQAGIKDIKRQVEKL